MRSLPQAVADARRIPGMVPVGRLGLLLSLALAGPLSGCASMASGVVADAISGSGGSLAQDDDPEFAAQAVPFGLKTMETVLEAEPDHVGLLTTLAGGYAMYGYAFLAEEADRLREDHPEQAAQLTRRARGMYARAIRYGMRGLSELADGDFEAKLRANPGPTLQALDDAEEAVPLLYWTAAAWALSIASSDLDPEQIADLPLVVQLAERAIALNPDFQRGALQSMMGSIEVAQPGGDLGKAERHYQRAIALSEDTQVSPYVGYAENVLVKRQDARAFHRTLDQALKVDLSKDKNSRLANEIARRRALWLKARSGDLFLEDVPAGPDEPQP